MGSVGDGEVVKIVGLLGYSQEPLRAPISGRRCAFWEVVVERYHGGSNADCWTEDLRDSSGQDFVLQDGRHRALIRPEGARALIAKERSFQAGLPSAPSPRMKAFLEAQGVVGRGLLVEDRPVRCREGVLEKGEVVAVLGRARWELDPDGAVSGGGYRQSPRRLVMEARKDAPLLLSDDPMAISTGE